VNRARELGFASVWNDLEKLLGVAEIWIDPDILRAHVLKDGPAPAGTRYGIAFVPADGVMGERWYLVAMAGARRCKCSSSVSQLMTTRYC